MREIKTSRLITNVRNSRIRCRYWLVLKREIITSHGAIFQLVGGERSICPPKVILLLRYIYLPQHGPSWDSFLLQCCLLPQTTNSTFYNNYILPHPCILGYRGGFTISLPLAIKIPCHVHVDVYKLTNINTWLQVQLLRIRISSVNKEAVHPRATRITMAYVSF